MAIVGTNLATTGTVATQSSYTTGTIAPNAGQLVLLGVANRKASGTAEVPTVTGCNLTWTRINTLTLSGFAAARLSLFWAWGSAPTSGALTIDFGGVNQTMCRWSIIQFTGLDPAMTSSFFGPAIEQDNSNTVAGSFNVSVQMNAYAHQNNGTFLVSAAGGSGAITAFTSSTSWTSTTSLAGVNGWAIGAEWIDATLGLPRTAQASWSSGSAPGWTGIAVELAVWQHPPYRLLPDSVTDALTVVAYGPLPGAGQPI